MRGLKRSGQKKLAGKYRSLANNGHQDLGTYLR